MKTIACPICGAEEAEGAFLCGSCGADLSLLAPPGAVAPRPSPVPTPVAPAEAERTCPRCGARNEAWALLCVGCASDLPCPSEEVSKAETQASMGLTLLIHGRSFPCASGDVLGREGTVAAKEFEAVGTVHRRHVLLRFEKGRWHVVALEATRNLTELDGQRLERGRSHPLTAEHCLRLSSRLTVLLKVQPAT